MTDKLPESRSTTPTSVGVEETNDWIAEAQAVISDIKPFVKEASISNQLSTSLASASVADAYFNIHTKESKSLTIQINSQGFTIVSPDKLDTIDLNYKASRTFETPYALLSFISPSYTESFASKLSEKLKNLGDIQ